MPYLRGFSGVFLCLDVCAAAVDAAVLGRFWASWAQKRTPTADDAPDLKLFVKSGPFPPEMFRFPVETTAFPDVSRVIPSFPAFLNYIVPVQLALMVLPVVNTFGFSRGAFTFSNILWMLPGLVLSPFLGTISQRLGLRKMILLGALWGAVALGILSACRTLYQFYFVFLLGGFGFGPCSTYVASVLLNGWFQKRRSFVCSVVMAGTGVGGMLWGIIVPSLVQRFTYRAGYWFCSVAWLVLMLVCAALTRGLPQDVGVLPYGGEPAETAPVPAPASAQRRRLLLQPCFWLLCAANFSLSLVNSFYPHTQSFLVDHSFTIVAAGRVISLFSIALVVFKLLLGVYFERKGLRRGILLPTAVDFAALFLLFAGRPSLLTAAVILFAANSSLVSMTPLLSAGEIYHPQEFAALWGILSSVGSIGNSVGSPLWGLLYDVSGSYKMGFVVAMVLLGMWLLIYRNLLAGKRPENDNRENQNPPAQ